MNRTISGIPLPDEDHERLNRIRTAIAAGTYRIDAADIRDYITYEWASTFAANPPNFQPGRDHANRPAVEPKPYAALELLDFLTL
jgi:hypothetical protein